MTYVMETDETLRALRRHGTAEFPFACYRDRLDESHGSWVDWHWHSELEFSLVLSGPVDCLIDSERHTLHEGDALFINAGAIHRFEAFGGGMLMNFLCAPELLAPEESLLYSRYVAPVLDAELPCRKFSRQNPAAQPLLTVLDQLRHQAEDKPPQWELRVQILLLTLWSALLPEICAEPKQTKPGKDRRLRGRLQRMLNYISEHYAEDICLSDIAAAASVSQSEALRCFHQGVHTTPVNYLNRYRLSQAQKRLLETADPIGAVALECGFGSSAYFCRLFRRQWGTSPQVFRNHWMG